MTMDLIKKVLEASTCSETSAFRLLLITLLVGRLCHSTHHLSGRWPFGFLPPDPTVSSQLAHRIQIVRWCIVWWSSNVGQPVTCHLAGRSGYTLCSKPRDGHITGVLTWVVSK